MIILFWVRPQLYYFLKYIKLYIFILKNIIYLLKKNDIFIVFEISYSKITLSKSAAKSAWLGALLPAIPYRSKRARVIPCALGSFAGEAVRSLHIPTRFDTLAWTRGRPLWVRRRLVEFDPNTCTCSCFRLGFYNYDLARTKEGIKNCPALGMATTEEHCQDWMAERSKALD